PPHVAADVQESRALFDLVKEQGRNGASGIVQGERALRKLAHDAGGTEGAYGKGGDYPVPYLPETKESA
ncbi:MAG: hypothetical protein ABI927_00700, partial [Gaiellaceae bacterium]